VSSVPNTRPLVAERVFATLLQRLLTGDYAPERRLPAQRALAAELGVTMTALREALKRLEQMGMIEVRHGNAMSATRWRESGTLDVLAHLLVQGDGLDPGVLGDILEARCYMLRELAGLAAARTDAERSARISELAAAVPAAPDASAAALIDFAFFTEIARAAENVVFLLILNSIRSVYLEHAQLIPVTTGHQQLGPMYIALARAIAEGEVEAARASAWELACAQRERVGV
jgi:GntR family transcriptional repressor for pyruvate dehydrogenase complex